MNLERLEHPTVHHYVIVLSEHNVAEFNTLLQFKPKNVHVIATQRMTTKVLDRFKNAFENNAELQSNCKLHVIGENTNLIGERINEITDCAHSTPNDHPFHSSRDHSFHPHLTTQ